MPTFKTSERAGHTVHHDAGHPIKHFFTLRQPKGWFPPFGQLQLHTAAVAFHFSLAEQGKAIEIDQIHPPEIMCAHGMHVVFICDAWSVHVNVMSCYAMPCMLTCMRDLFAVYRAPARSLDASSKANFNPAQARTCEKLSCDQKTQRQESCRISHQSRRICPFGMSFLCQMHDLANPIFIHPNSIYQWIARAAGKPCHHVGHEVQLRPAIE